MKKNEKINLPLVSVIMNCHNGEKYLKKSVRSVLSQSYKNWELIFYNNKSLDNSEKIIKNFKEKRIKYFKSNKKKSLYSARNHAISKAKGKYVSFLDVDDWWMPSKLNKQVKLIEKKNCDLIFSNLYYYNQKTKEKTIYNRKKIQEKKFTQSLLNNYCLAILTVLMDKKIFNKNKFNKKYNIVGDFDFFIKLSLKKKFSYISEPLAFYRLHKKNYSKNFDVYLKEMEHWSNKNIKKFEKLDFSMKKIKLLIYKLKIKNYLKGTIAHW